MTAGELRERAFRFYNRYAPEIEQVKDLLSIKLKQMALAYTINNKLPREAILVNARVKTLESFLKKLEQNNWPEFYFPTEVVHDLIGARVVCWFLDDCYGFLEVIKGSNQFKIVATKPVKDYITKPQAAGYRGLHVFAEVLYDSVQKLMEK